MGQRHTDPQPHAARSFRLNPAPSFALKRPDSMAASDLWRSLSAIRRSIRRLPPRDQRRLPLPRPRGRPAIRSAAPLPATPPRPVSPFSQALVPSDSTRGRRAQDDFDYQQSQGFPDRRAAPHPSLRPTLPTQDTGRPCRPRRSRMALRSTRRRRSQPKPIVSQPSPAQSSVADTLQHSRERVAARWFALKGVFEQPGQEHARSRARTSEGNPHPVLAVFSLAGGVGKTSLVATVGRALSSMGEKVLLTDTTSHGLLPFYFGASELRQGTVRTFSPPSGSTDAPIYLVSYDVDQKGSDAAAQEQLAEEIINNSRGTHRILLDLTVGSSWIVRRMSRMNPTILVPVAPDMNSVISLQTVEKFFSGVNDGDGRPLQPFYVLNQFDTSLPAAPRCPRSDAPPARRTPAALRHPPRARRQRSPRRRHDRSRLCAGRARSRGLSQPGHLAPHRRRTGHRRLPQRAVE